MRTPPISPLPSIAASAATAAGRAQDADIHAGIGDLDLLAARGDEPVDAIEKWPCWLSLGIAATASLSLWAGLFALGWQVARRFGQ